MPNNNYNSKLLSIKVNNWNPNKPIPELNNRSCPDCDNELYDTNPHEVISKDGMRCKLIHCENCGYKGSRITII